MCEYCKKRTGNKFIKDVDNDKEDFARVVKLGGNNPMLVVELEGEDPDGYKPTDYFEINYCPMCR